MQASDHYFTTQVSIFLLINNLTDSFSSALGNPLFRMGLWLHTSEKTVEMFNWRNYILGEISLLHYILCLNALCREKNSRILFQATVDSVCQKMTWYSDSTWIRYFNSLQMLGPR